MLSKGEATRQALYICFPDQAQAEIGGLVEKDQSIRYALDEFHTGELPLRTMIVSLSEKGHNPCFGFLWCTNRRLLFVASVSGFLIKPHSLVRDWGRKTIERVDFNKSTRFQGAKILLRRTEDPETVLFKSIVKNERLQTFVDDLNAWIANPAALQPSEASNAAGSEAGSLADELERLSNLKSKGFLNDDEFASAKQKLLGS